MKTAARISRLLVSLLIVLAGAGAAGASTLTAHEERQVPLPEGRTLLVQNVNGAVKVGVWDRQEVRLQALRTAKGPSPERAKALLAELRVEVLQEATRVVVRTRDSRDGSLLGWLRDGSTQGRVDYTLTVPRHAVVEIATVNGRVEVHGLAGQLRARSTNGSIRLQEIAGEVSASSTNGSIQASVIDTAPAGLELSTVNGSIALHLPVDVRADIDARTVNGGVASALPLAVESSRSRSRLVGSLGGGGALVKLRTTNGSIRLAGLN
jgi:hypothetical protein